MTVYNEFEKIIGKCNVNNDKNVENPQSTAPTPYKIMEGAIKRWLRCR